MHRQPSFFAHEVGYNMNASFFKNKLTTFYEVFKKKMEESERVRQRKVKKQLNIKNYRENYKYGRNTYFLNLFKKFYFTFNTYFIKHLRLAFFFLYLPFQ